METEVTEVFINGSFCEDLPASNYEPAAYWQLSTKEPGMLERAEPDPSQLILEKEIGKQEEARMDTVLVISDDSDVEVWEEPKSNWLGPGQYPGTLIVVEQDPPWNITKDGIGMTMWLDETPQWKVISEVQGTPKQIEEPQWEAQMEDPSTLKQKEAELPGNVSTQDPYAPKQTEDIQCEVIKEGPPLSKEIEGALLCKELVDNLGLKQIVESHCSFLEQEPTVPPETERTVTMNTTQTGPGTVIQIEEPYLNLCNGNLSTQKQANEKHPGITLTNAPGTETPMQEELCWEVRSEEAGTTSSLEEHQTSVQTQVIDMFKVTEELQRTVVKKGLDKPKQQVADNQVNSNNNELHTTEQTENTQTLDKRESSIPEQTGECGRLGLKKERGSSKLIEVPHHGGPLRETGELKLTDEHLGTVSGKEPSVHKQIDKCQWNMLNDDRSTPKQSAEEPSHWKSKKLQPGTLNQTEDPQWNSSTHKSCTPDCFQESWKTVLKKERGSPEPIGVPQGEMPPKVLDELKLDEEHLNKFLRKETGVPKQSQCNKLNEAMGSLKQTVEPPQWKGLMEETVVPKPINAPQWNLGKDPSCAPVELEEPWRKALKKEQDPLTSTKGSLWSLTHKVPGKMKPEPEPLNRILGKDTDLPKQKEKNQCKPLNEDIVTLKLRAEKGQGKEHKEDTHTEKQCHSSRGKLGVPERVEESWRMVLKKERGSPKPIEVPQGYGPDTEQGKLKLDAHLQKSLKKEPCKLKETEQSELKAVNEELRDLPPWKLPKEEPGAPKPIEDPPWNLGKEESCAQEQVIEPWRKAIKKERGSPKPIEVPHCKGPQKVPEKLKLEEGADRKSIKEEPGTLKRTEDPPLCKVLKEEPGTHMQFEESQRKTLKEGPKQGQEDPQQKLSKEATGLHSLVGEELHGKALKTEHSLSEYVQREQPLNGSCKDLNIGLTHPLSKNKFKNILNKFLDPSIEYTKRPECPSGQHMYQCLACTKLFTSPSFLNSHYSMHLDQKPGECPVCGKSFRWPSRLEQHLLEHTGPWPYRCSVCQYNPSDGRSLFQGSYMHAGDRLYKCVSCKLCFVNAYDLQRHKQKHHSHFNGRAFPERSMVREAGHFQCLACSRSFNSEFSLKVHRCRNAKKRLHTCSICGMEFKYPYYLARHYATHTKVRPFQCNICLKSFRRLTHLTRHHLIHSNEQPYHDAISSNSFMQPNHAAQPQQPSDKEAKEGETQGAVLGTSTTKTQDASGVKQEPRETKEILPDKHNEVPITGLVERQVLLQDNWTFLCLACNRTFERKWDVKVHKCPGTLGKETGTDGSRTYQCSVCSKYFARPWSLNRHYRVHTKEKPFSCPDCGVSFRLLSTLKQHSRTHMSELPFSCTLCHQSFQKSSDLSHHLQGHAEEEPYRCIYCDRRFSKACTMQQHQQTHAHIQAALLATKEGMPASDLGDYQCHSCNTIYPDAKGLLAHDCPNDLSTSGDTLHRKGYECNVCDKSFKSKYDLASHYLIHTGELPFQCPKCGKRFRRLSHLKQHDVSHTVARPFKCVVCKKEFKRLADLSRHREVHNNQKAHQCGVCYKYFSRSYSLLRHQRSHTPCFVPNVMQETVLSNSCFDSQDHSAFAQMEDEPVQ
ncbi:uncharacterized protein [Ambystoma mexicanum]|uniref:uncharacterized protein n=1 Tax=Ambystoma mexicanum TaxID=8296 RepID=UPI0037E80C4D